MRTIGQLRIDFALYLDEIARCEAAKCYWALLHILLSIPDVCASLEASPSTEVGDRYVDWCEKHLPQSPAVSGADRYQMRNALLHAGSTTAQNRGKKHQTGYTHFSYVDPEGFDVSVHDTTSPDGRILNVNVLSLAAETRQALEHWFDDLQRDPIAMSHVEGNIERLTRRQPKRIVVTEPTGTQTVITGWTTSST